MKKFLAFLLAMLMVLSLAACGDSGSGDSNKGSEGAEPASDPKAKDPNDDGVIRVWVGEESAEFYQKICDQYVADHPDFGYTIVVKGMDTGSVAGKEVVILQDPYLQAFGKTRLLQPGESQTLIFSYF